MKVTAVTVQAHAKINIGLHVLGKLPHGFHELRTIFQSLDLHDTITFQIRQGPMVLRCRKSGVPLDQTNLVWRATAELWCALGREGEPRDLSITIVKHIPLKAGLGGGSTDAAAALMALARLWHPSLTLLQLHEIAVNIGTDVPFFLSGGTALGLERGDWIYQLVDLPHYWVVIVIPGVGVSTPEAYAWYDEVKRPRTKTQHEVPTYGFPQVASMVNDLESAVIQRIPEIDLVKKVLLDAGAVGAAMSGSGSAVFGLFNTRSEATAARLLLSSSGWRSILTRTINRKEYVRLSRDMVPIEFKRRSRSK